MKPSDRIDGWKAIGAHFGRDRTTAMRWARARGLPVKRIPGGKRATVYALRSDLDRWAQSHADVVAEPTEPVASAQSALTIGRRVPRGLMGGSIALILAVCIVGGWALNRQELPIQSPATIALPVDGAVARRYLQARDDWAERTPESLTRAIAALETVTRQDPGFAPAFAALADAHLLQREFGAVPDTAAFDQARRAAQAALAIDADLPGAHRAMGFIAYWRDHDPAAAGRSFRRAIELAPESAQSHFWYGNVLADNGQAEAAARELNRARLLEPGSIAIQTDIAWADWSAGREDEARLALERLVRTAPSFPVAHDCLAIVRLAEGDYAGYVAAYREYARLRGDPALIAHAAALHERLPLGLPALQERLMAHAGAQSEAQGGRDHAWPAFLASVAGDRKALLAVLETAAGRNERWGSAGLRAAVGRRWEEDAQVIGLLDRVKPPLVE